VSSACLKEGGAERLAKAMDDKSLPSSACHQGSFEAAATQRNLCKYASRTLVLLRITSSALFFLLPAMGALSSHALLTRCLRQNVEVNHHEAEEGGGGAITTKTSGCGRNDCHSHRNATAEVVPLKEHTKK